MLAQGRVSRVPAAEARSSSSSWRTLLSLTLLALALAVFPGSAAAYIYFPNGVHIGRALNDGTGLEPNFISTGTFNCGVAVDDGHIYWGALGKGISRANLDGTGVEEEFIPLPSSAAPCGVAVDSTHVYWTDRSGAVGMADLDGENANPALISIGEPCGIASDGGHVYFAWRNGSEFHLSRFAVPYSGLESPLTATTGNCGVAVGGQDVYWANGGPASTTGQTVQLANRDPFGPPAILVVTAGGAERPWSVAAHGEFAYYSSYNGPIGRVRADGSAAPEPDFLPLGGGSVETVGIAVDDLPLSPPPLPQLLLPSTAPPAGSAGGGPVSTPKPRLSVGKVQPNVRNGTAKVTVTVSAPGVVGVAGRKVKPARATVKHAGQATLTIRAKKAALGALQKAGHLRVSFTVSFSAPGAAPVSTKGSVKLALRDGAP